MRPVRSSTLVDQAVTRLGVLEVGGYSHGGAA